jgi:hypothetical protein
MGQSQRALVRLLGEANRHGNDPRALRGAVVQGVATADFTTSPVAAHAEAPPWLDPNVPTEPRPTLLMECDYRAAPSA